MQVDILMLNIHGPPLKPHEYAAIRTAAVLYLRYGGFGPEKFAHDEPKLEGYIEQIGTHDADGISGAKMRADIGLERGVLRMVEFIVPWSSVNIDLEEGGIFMVLNPVEETEKSQPPPKKSKLLH